MIATTILRCGTATPVRLERFPLSTLQLLESRRLVLRLRHMPPRLGRRQAGGTHETPRSHGCSASRCAQECRLQAARNNLGFSTHGCGIWITGNRGRVVTAASVALLGKSTNTSVQSVLQVAHAFRTTSMSDNENGTAALYGGTNAPRLATDDLKRTTTDLNRPAGRNGLDTQRSQANFPRVFSSHGTTPH